MKIDIQKGPAWNDNVVSFIEEPSGMGDAVLIVIDTGKDQVTVKVWRSDLTRAAQMLSVPYQMAAMEFGGEKP